MSPISLTILSFLLLAVSAQRIPRSSLSTTLSCQERCVPDGIGQQQLNESCAAGDFDKFCTPIRCSCPSPPQQVSILCESDACLSNFRRRSARVRFGNNNPDFVYVVTYTVRGTVFDKVTSRPGACQVLLSGSYRPRTRGVVVTNAIAQAVVDDVLEALISEGSGKRSTCARKLRRVAQNAADKVFEMDTGEAEMEAEGVSGRMKMERIDVRRSDSTEM
ncbi:unnamed protein product [Chondrus crispus]|uniref:Uncharacterized protein n=1 Tax=Chondrus crispus TaxID=2769 RepID=R7QIP1_CHOCR|nr:unnamed protein product [Chondrus crispus]CDF37290.1 unnamed protein product [Chondrus crispus]|eukprot:XP_005717109.1 unnamed protein product [Chondrus crispus]